MLCILGADLWEGPGTLRCSVNVTLSRQKGKDSISSDWEPHVGVSQWGLDRKRIRWMQPGKRGEDPDGERWKAEWEAVPRKATSRPTLGWGRLERWEIQRKGSPAYPKECPESLG